MEFPRSVLPFLVSWIVIAVPAVVALYVFAPSWVAVAGLVVAGALLAGGLHTIRSGGSSRA